MKINIIGSAPEWQNAPTDGICWGFNTHILKRPYNVVFDMHDINRESSGFRNNGWKLSKHKHDESIDLCLDRDVTVFSLGSVKDSTIIEYPLGEICKYFDTDYFSCGAAYAIALALYQGATEIDIWGIFLSFGDEHAYQKPCIEYWIGRAQGMGVKVEVHGMTRLLKNLRDNIYGYNYKQKVRL